MYAIRKPMDHRVCQELFIDTSMEYELDYTKFPELLDSRYMYEPMLRIVSKLDDSPLSSTEQSSVSVDSQQAGANRNFHKSVPDHTSWISENEIDSRCLCLGEYCLCDSDISDEALLALMGNYSVFCYNLWCAAVHRKYYKHRFNILCSNIYIYVIVIQGFLYSSYRVILMQYLNVSYIFYSPSRVWRFTGAIFDKEHRLHYAFHARSHYAAMNA